MAQQMRIRLFFIFALAAVAFTIGWMRRSEYGKGWFVSNKYPRHTIPQVRARLVGQL
jgi:hypothetical protein